MQQLPTGLQEFEYIRKEKLLYVDKTALIYNLASDPKKLFFLSRPRRFGKTLLCSALTSLFEGKKEQFKGLAISKTKWKWEKHPVIRLDMSLNTTKKQAMLAGSTIKTQLKTEAKRLGLSLKGDNLSSNFMSLIYDAHDKYKKPAVVIIDEYDSPLLSVIDDKETFNKIRDMLKDFYKVLKFSEKHLRFSFLTGITKFAQVSVFSALNNLNDITFDPEYAALLGITQGELEKDFADYINKFASEFGTKKSYLTKLKDFYNGYRFSEKELTVYNPFGLLKHFENGKFIPYWFSSGSPSYLMKLIEEQKIDILDMDNSFISYSTFGNYDSDNMEAVPVLYQSGYLTIKEYVKEIYRFILGYPNTEVRSAFANELAVSYLKTNKRIKDSFYTNAVTWLYTGDIESVMEKGFIPFMASIPYDIAIKKEKYFQTIFHIIFNMFGFQCRSEVKIATGRIDTILETPKFVYCFEFKLTGTAAEALKQIDDKEYLTPWKGKGKALYKIGVSFDYKKRKIKEWRVN